VSGAKVPPAELLRQMQQMGIRVWHAQVADSRSWAAQDGVPGGPYAARMGDTVPDDGRSPFDPPLEEMVGLGGAAVDFAARFVEDRYTAPNADLGDLEEVLEIVRASPPTAGRSFDELLGLLQLAAAKGFDPANPGFMGYIPGGGLYASALGDFLACVVNRYTGLARPAPALVQLEQSVLRWLCDLFGLPQNAQGLLTPGGSMSTFTAVVAAREARLGEQFLDGALYVSDEVHHSVAKAAKIAGFPADAVRVVPADDALRLEPEALVEAIGRDRAAGRRPFMVVASAGTINAGMVDPLDAVADVAEREGLWLHVDAAYGGFFQLTDRGRAALCGIERADTVTLDPHKGLFLPYGTGCLLARDGGTLRAAHEVAAHYLPDVTDGLPDFSAYGPELTRDFRGLRLWLPLHMHGTDAFRDALDEKLDLAHFMHAQLAALPELEVPWRPDLSLVAFRPRGATDAECLRLLDRIHDSGRVWLSSAPIRGRVFLRACILSHRSRSGRVEEFTAIVRDAVAA
jgi:aromatic-L-amino-acid/L-tryptophan decarboxylase